MKFRVFLTTDYEGYKRSEDAFELKEGLLWHSYFAPNLYADVSSDEGSPLVMASQKTEDDSTYKMIEMDERELKKLLALMRLRGDGA